MPQSELTHEHAASPAASAAAETGVVSRCGIFVTVGSDGPFDRLIAAIDAWAGRNGRTDVFAQIGESRLKPGHVAYRSFLEPADFTRYFQQASVIIAHAGMGTILSALRYGKPLLVMPRRASLGEQRNEHQLATARHLNEMGKIVVAFDEHELIERLDRLDELDVRARTGAFAEPRLTQAIHQFIQDGKIPAR